MPPSLSLKPCGPDSAASKMVSGTQSILSIFVIIIVGFFFNLRIKILIMLSVVMIQSLLVKDYNIQILYVSDVLFLVNFT